MSNVSPVQARAERERAQIERGVAGRAEIVDSVHEHGMLRLRVRPDDRPAALDALKGMGFTHYVFCGGVDWPDEGRMEVLDQVYSVQRRQRVTLRCDVPRDAPRLPSATAVYAGANWHERETWEMFGIVFAGHPRLVRLLLADWQEGFPLRKDSPLPAREEKPWPGESFKPEE